MSGKTYVGNTSGKAVKPSKIYIGSSNGKATAVRAVYVGNSSGKAEKVWPSSILPEGYKSYSYFGGFRCNINDVKMRDNPRVVVSYSISSEDAYTTKSGGWLVYGYYAIEDKPAIHFDCGHQYNSNTKNYICWIEYGGTDGETYRTVTKNPGSFDAVHIFDFNRTNGDYKQTYLDSKLLFSVPAYNNFYSDETIRIGHGYLSYNYKFLRIHYVEIYTSSNTLIKTLYPARREHDSSYGLYDTMNDIFYTGAFNSNSRAIGPEL